MTIAYISYISVCVRNIDVVRENESNRKIEKLIRLE